MFVFCILLFVCNPDFWLLYINKVMLCYRVRPYSPRDALITVGIFARRHSSTRLWNEDGRKGTDDRPDAYSLLYRRRVAVNATFIDLHCVIYYTYRSPSAIGD